MNDSSQPNRDSFQKILENAFAVQESQMNTQSLSAFVETQRLIASGDLEPDHAMNLIAECAGKVADAAGVAVGLLQGNELIYRAGSGSASEYVGRHLVAALNVSADTGAIREILRIEDAQKDSSIGAAICRQFAAKSLLMLLIQHDHKALGVLQVLFAEPHKFAESEVRAYRLMAGLIREVADGAAQLDARTTPPAPLLVPQTIEQSAFPIHMLSAEYVRVSAPRNNRLSSRLRRTAATVAEAVPILRQQLYAATSNLRITDSLVHRNRWSLAAATVLTATAIAASIGYTHHRSVLGLRGSTLQSQPQAAALLTKPVPSNDSSTILSSTLDTVRPTAPNSGFRRVRVGDHEIDYVSEDVTVRYFTPSTASQRARGEFRQVDIGDDVTVRYFAFRPASLSDAAPAASVGPNADQPTGPQKTKLER